MNCQLKDFSSSITKMARKMLYTNPGQLLTIIHEYDIDIGFDIPSINSILMEIYNRKDYHTFLKNAHRFGIYEGLRSEIEAAIGKIKREEEAQCWRTKFGQLKMSEFR